MSVVFSEPGGLWTEIRVDGKKIPARSGQASALIGSILYIHGGQRPDIVLDDLWAMPLSSSPPRWHELPFEGLSPGPRSLHKMVATHNNLLLMGGIDNRGRSQATVWHYCVVEQIWEQRAPMPVALHSFVAQFCDGRVILLTGFCSSTAKFNRSLLVYHCRQDKWESIEMSPQAIPARMGACSCLTNESIFLFGGIFDRRLSDLWEIDTTTFQIQQKIYSKIRPRRRSGAVLCPYDGGLLLFGGIYDVTNQLDDLHYYDLKDQQWFILSQIEYRADSIIMPNKSMLSVKEIPPAKERPSKLSFYFNINAKHQFPEKLLSQSVEPPPLRSSNQTGRMRHLHRKQQKNKFLSTFDCKQMTPSIDHETNMVKKAIEKITIDTDFLPQRQNASICKFSQPLKSHAMDGRRPCARDGHSGHMWNDKLFIFGGDRHLISFNDFFCYNPELI